MRIVQIPNGRFVENCYFVIDEAAGECAIIDPGEEAGMIAHKLQTERVTPIGIWLTHAHIDHVLGVPRLKADTGAPVYLHPADRLLYDHVPEQGVAFGMRAERLPAPDRELVHGDVLRVGNLRSASRPPPGPRPGGAPSKAREAGSGATGWFWGPSGEPT